MKTKAKQIQSRSDLSARANNHGLGLDIKRQDWPTTSLPVSILSDPGELWSGTGSQTKQNCFNLQPTGLDVLTSGVSEGPMELNLPKQSNHMKNKQKPNSSNDSTNPISIHELDAAFLDIVVACKGSHQKFLRPTLLVFQDKVSSVVIGCSLHLRPPTPRMIRRNVEAWASKIQSDLSKKLQVGSTFQDDAR